MQTKNELTTSTLRFVVLHTHIHTDRRHDRGGKNVTSSTIGLNLLAYHISTQSGNEGWVIDNLTNFLLHFREPHTTYRSYRCVDRNIVGRRSRPHRNWSLKRLAWQAGAAPPFWEWGYKHCCERSDQEFFSSVPPTYDILGAQQQIKYVPKSSKPSLTV